jgi:hypothetical protein
MQLKTCVASWLRRLVAAAVLCLIGAPALAQTPTLGELARQEQERRKGLKTAGKVITNKDLPKPYALPTPSQQPALPPAAPAADAQAPKKDALKEPEKDEAWWHDRITRVRDGLQRSQVFAEALQSRINALTADFVNRDDPYQRAKIAEDRQKAIAELDRVKSEIEQATKEIADIEEEARQAGIPPGWIR